MYQKSNSCLVPPGEAVEHLEVPANAVSRRQISQLAMIDALFISTHLEGRLI